MSDDKILTGLLPRRRFLGSAAAVTLAVGAEAALRPKKAAAALAAPNPLSIAYWNGKRFIPAAHLSGVCDRSLCADGIQVTIDAPTCANAYETSKTARELRAVNAHFHTGADTFPFYAWTAASHGRPAVTFPMPVDATKGIALSIETGAGEHLCRFTTGTEKNTIALRAGTYLIAVGTLPPWLLCHFDAAQASAPLSQRTRRGPVPVAFDYVIVTIARA